jgi:menaquinone-9 beta-reductase
MKPVVIAGGGPAGSAAALALRRRGVPVLLLDQAQFPRDKVCGDVILPDAQDTLRALGLDLAECGAQTLPCTGVRYQSPGGRAVSGRFRGQAGEERSWVMMKRRDFDAWLLRAARDAGAEIREGWRVDTVMRDGRHLTGVQALRQRASAVIAADLAIGADGASSAVARSVGLFARPAEHLCLAARSYVRAPLSPEPFLEVFTTAQSLPGCAWIVPVGNGEYNVGAGIIQADAQRRGTNPNQLFRQMRDELPAFAARLHGVNIPPMKGWFLPSTSEGRKLAGPGFLLAGDAGAMVDPFTGHGIHHALSAGCIAGEVAADAIEQGRDLSVETLTEYESRCREAFLRDAGLGYWLQRFHAQALAVRMAIGLIGRHEGLRRLFLALVGHTAPRHLLLSPGTLGRAVLGR